MKQDPRENLQDLLRDLREARRDSEEQRRLGAALLEGLGIVSRPRPAAEMAAEMLSILENTLEFQHAVLLAADEDGEYRAWRSTAEQFEETAWPVGSLFERVIDGSVVAIFDVTDVPEWTSQPETVRAGVTSALHASITGGGYRTILVCTHPDRGYFTRSHVRLMEGFVPLASQAMLRAWTYEREHDQREAASVGTLARSRASRMDHALDVLGIGVAIWSQHGGLAQASPYLEELVAPCGGIELWWRAVRESFESAVMVSCPECGAPQHIGSRRLALERLDGGESLDLQVTYGGHIHEYEGSSSRGEVLLVRGLTGVAPGSDDQGELSILRSADDDPVLRANCQGLLLFANAAAAPLLRHWNVRPGERLPIGLRERIALARSRGTTPTLEVEIDDRIVDLRLVAPRELDQVVVYGRDVTEKRRTQRALEGSEARKRLLLQASLDAAVTMDHEGKVVDWGARAVELFGWSEAEAVGRHMASLIIPERLRETHSRGLEHYLRTGEGAVIGQRIEVPAMRKSGEEIPAELYVQVLESSEGGEPLFAGFIRDVREQKKASDDLKAANSRLSALIRSTTSGVFVRGDAGLVTLVNDPLCRMFALPDVPDGLIGSDAGPVLHSMSRSYSDAGAFLRRIDDDIESRIERGIEEFVLQDGRVVEVEYSEVRADEELLGHMWQFRDITERRRASEVLERARAAEVLLGGQIQDLFLRGRPPERHPRLDIAVLSVPSQGLDGDFVDFIPHGPDCLDVIVGDVMGKGLAASLLGAAVKNSFARALAAVASGDSGPPSPKSVVGFVHDALAGRLISVESFATVLYARLSLAEQQIEYVGCGHPPAIRYSGSSRSCSLLSGEDPPIGFVHHNDYSSFRVPIDPGDVLVLYSDGITEAFNPEGEMLGQDRLIEAVRAAAELPASQIVQEVARLISDFTAAALDPKDDLTLVVVRMRHGEVRFEGEVQELVIPRRSPRLHEMRAFVGGIVGEAYPGAREGYAGEVVRAVQEAVTNAMRHPRPQDPESPVMVRVETAREELVVEVRYDGHPFQPETVELPDVSQFPQGGFGLYIIEQSMDNVSYGRAADGRNFIRLVKRAP